MPSAEQSIPSHLTPLIYYCELFPPDFVAPARRLIALWVAEDLVQHNTDARSHLNELIHLKVLVAKRDRSGKVKTCRIDAGRRDAVLEEMNSAYDYDFFQEKRGHTRRLVDCNGSRSDSSIQIHGNSAVSQSVKKYRHVTSFLSFNTQEGSKPGEDIGDFLRNCIAAGCFVQLRVLDLERVFRPKLPDTLGKLRRLKYLGLRWTFLEQLPDSVHRLLDLKVLDVKHTYISVLPRSIWSMQFLRHLYLSEAYRTRFPRPPSRITLTALQTLWGAFVDEDTRVVRGLDTLLNIRKLGLSCRSRPYNPDRMLQQLKAIDKWIPDLKFLDSLRLKSRDEGGEAAPLRLTTLQMNTQLSTLYLLGKLDRLCKLPVSVTDITLSGSALGVDPLPYLGRLPNLVFLRLLAQSVACNTVHCPRIGFRRLEVLWLWKLENLKQLEAEEGSLPCLQELEIRSCPQLAKLPDRLQHVRNLEIKLTSMPLEFVQKLEGRYDKLEHVPQDDQYILANPHETEDKCDE